MVNDQTNMFDNIQLNEDIVNDDTFNNMHNLNNLNILIYNIKVLFSEKHFIHILEKLKNIKSFLVISFYLIEKNSRKVRYLVIT